MTPAQYNLPSVVSGDTFNAVQFTITSQSVPVDLTGCTIRMYLRRQTMIGPVYRTFTNNIGGITILDALNGVFQLNQFQARIPPNRYWYDIEITFATGVVKTYLQGTLTVLQDVTT